MDMTEAHDPHAHHGPDVKSYLVVFGALAVFTLVSFVVNYFTGVGSTVGLVIIMAVAVVKAVLVAAYFMHLKYDWGKLFFMIIPCLILATMLVVVLLPDIVLAWR